jgi:hypothetical protein
MSLGDLKQRTFGSYGHFLNHRQAQLCGSQTLLYDTRNNDPEIAKARRIEAIDLRDDSIRLLYDTQSNSPHGPGVAAAVCHPLRSTALFIHGLFSCDEKNPYSMTRRFGGLLDIDATQMIDATQLPTATSSESSSKPSSESLPVRPSSANTTTSKFRPLENRSLAENVPWGTLRGGTHAHSFSPDGRWVSFTYNDAVIATRDPQADRRTVGIALLKPPAVSKSSHNKSQNAHAAPDANHEEWSQGAGWATLVLDPVHPISAREECWVPNASSPALPPRLAFIGRLPQTSKHPSIDEVFLAELPPDAWDWPESLHGFTPTDPLSGRLQPPPGITVRQLTYSDRLAPELLHPDPGMRGVQGPRHWLSASACGRWIYSLFRDSSNCVRAVRISTISGQIQPLSPPGMSVTRPPAIDPSGRSMSLILEDVLHVLDLESLQLFGVQGWPSQGSQCPWDEFVGPVHFLRTATPEIFWNARPKGSSWLQIWTARLQ